MFLKKNTAYSNSNKLGVLKNTWYINPLKAKGPCYVSIQMNFGRFFSSGQKLMENKG